MDKLLFYTQVSVKLSQVQTNFMFIMLPAFLHITTFLKNCSYGLYIYLANLCMSPDSNLQL
jgi:hypothetical protein